MEEKIGCLQKDPPPHRVVIWELNMPGSGLPLRRDVSRRCPALKDHGDDRYRANPGSCAELKGSIGEGPNHSNHSNHSNRLNSFKIGIFTRKFKNFRKLKFQHFLNYRRNSDKISSKSEQKSVKRIKK